MTSISDSQFIFLIKILFEFRYLPSSSISINLFQLIRATGFGRPMFVEVASAVNFPSVVFALLRTLASPSESFGRHCSSWELIFNIHYTIFLFFHTILLSSDVAGIILFARLIWTKVAL